ncbi:MAG TPA: UDP-N-acetylmuramate dehydrogenase [Pyrinomonadaceae bacterium]|nr:UDP-N-acetylmuramate dehydrogenase [Pyrinomonadaceae bacterium]
MYKTIKVQENILLAPLTTLKVGGNARLFVRAETETQVAEAVKFAHEHEFALFVLGGGSNVLISDQGFDGLVIQIALKGIEFGEEKNGFVSVTAKSGEDWDDFVKICVEKDLQGLECLSGIPGFVGGTPVQNVGAYGQEVSETITKVRVFDRKSSEVLELSNADCKFTYRTSIFNSTDKNRFIVLAVTFNLKANGEPKVVYKDLREFFGETKPDLLKTREAILQIRRAKSMVIDASDPNSRSAGSFFKNPIVLKEEFEKLKENFNGEIPFFTVDDDSVKIPAAWLIEKSGFQKGFRKGKAGLSEKHTLAIVNFDEAKASDILELKNLIQETVEQKFAIRLIPEPILVGFAN